MPVQLVFVDLTEDESGEDQARRTPAPGTLHVQMLQ
jgi:hypothetical protein